MAEIEFSILGREWLERRIPDITALINEVNAQTEERNSKKSKYGGRLIESLIQRCRNVCIKIIHNERNQAGLNFRELQGFNHNHV